MIDECTSDKLLLISIFYLGDHDVVVIRIEVLLWDFDDRVNNLLLVARNSMLAVVVVAVVEDACILFLSDLIVLVQSSAILEQIIELTEAIIRQLIMSICDLSIFYLIILDGFLLQLSNNLLQILPKGVILEPCLAFDDLDSAYQLMVVLFGLSEDSSTWVDELTDSVDSLQLSLFLLSVLVLYQCVFRSIVALDGFFVISEHFVDLSEVELNLVGLSMDQIFVGIVLFLTGVNFIEQKIGLVDVPQRFLLVL